MTLERIDVRDLIGQPGASKTVRIRGTLDGLGTELATLKADEPVTGDLLLESVVEGVVISGRLRGVMALRCARCLVGFEAPVEVDVSELFALAPEADDEDVYPLDPEGWIDPEQLIRDALGLELPFSPLHRPDCQGICSVCGGDRNRGECPGDHDDVDPRWSALELVLQGMESGEPEERVLTERTTMAVPKKKQSKTRSAKRAATWKGQAPAYAECPQCHQPKLPHRVCGNCGYYAGRQAVEVE